jgi:hypothetical protein
MAMSSRFPRFMPGHAAVTVNSKPSLWWSLSPLLYEGLGVALIGVGCSLHIFALPALS